MYLVASKNQPTKTSTTMTGRNFVWGRKYGGRERISRNIAIRRLRRRFGRAEKVSTWKSSTGYRKIDATNIGSLPTTRRDGAAYDRPSFSGLATGVESLPRSPKKDKTKKAARTQYSTRKREKEINMSRTILLLFP